MSKLYRCTGSLGLVAAMLFGLASAVAGDGTGIETITVEIPIGDYSLESTADGCLVSVDDFGRLLVSGKPDLPSKIFFVAIPPDAELVDIDFTVGKEVHIDGSFNVRPSRLPRVVGLEDAVVQQQFVETYDRNYSSVYQSDDTYPESVVQLAGTSGLRRYNLVEIRVSPVSFKPKSGLLTFHSELTVDITYRRSPDNRRAQLSSSPRTERLAEKLILNHDQAAGWYYSSNIGRSVYDYVIITLESLTPSVTSLVDWETTKGRSVEVVTTEWIGASYAGYDLAEKIRNFLRDKYPFDEWGIEYVLLVGDYDDVPMRRCWQDVGYGMPETDYYYADLSLPDSLSWDSDGDHRYGENYDFIDFIPEVCVGRIPWSTPSTVQAICEKSVSFEQITSPMFKKNILLLGAYFWADTDNAVLMEAKADQSWMAEWSITRMYEKNGDYWSSYVCDYPLLHSNVMSAWSLGKFAFVNWAGHGSPTSSHILGIGSPAFISSSDCNMLNDNYPSIIFADACSNSDTDALNIGKAMLKQGGVAFVGATKVAFGCGGWTGPNDGSSQSLDYFFTTCVTSGDYTVGNALQWALMEMYSRGLWDEIKYEMFEWSSIWGNPNLGLGMPGLTLRLPQGVPDQFEYGVPQSVLLQINPGLDTYVPGSAQLHYRYDDGPFQMSPLSDLGGNLFEATLPAAECGDRPQFYFSAQGESTGIVLEPVDAPATVYTAIVGNLVTAFADDFETDFGWTVENDLNLTAGAWERGVPVGGGSRGDPPTDFDGSGSCYLTENKIDESDVDGGTTTLLSPSFDFEDQEPVISYARWYSNNYGGSPGEDVMEIRISSNGGTDWSLVETVGPVVQAGGGWFTHSFRVDDIITPTSDVVIRFDISDLGAGSVVEGGIDDFKVKVIECGPSYVCGDADGSGAVDIDDAVYLIAYIFTGGPPPDPMPAGDANCSSSCDIDDAVCIIQYIFAGGNAPGDIDGDGIPDC